MIKNSVALIVALFVIIGVNSPVAAQSVRWIPGIDITTVVYTTVAKDGTNGPLDAVIGLDTDSGQGGILYLNWGCYTPFTWRPTGGEGGIRHIVQQSWNTVWLLHESGHARLEYIPLSYWCVPVEVPK
jgi:hypothetical protein